MPHSAIPHGPIGDGDEVLLHSNGQEWILTWHMPDSLPAGRPHGSAGICVTPDTSVVIISADGARWDLPAGRPEGSEDWEEQPWEPRFEIRHRRVVPAADLLSHLTVEEGYLPTCRRALIEAGLA